MSWIDFRVNNMRKSENRTGAKNNRNKRENVVRVNSYLFSHRSFTNLRSLTTNITNI